LHEFCPLVGVAKIDFRDLKVSEEIKTMSVTGRQTIAPFTFEIASARGSRPRSAL